MPNTYYYLIAGLPEITLTGDAQKLDFESIYDDITRNLQDDDKAFLRYLLYVNDNRNLLSAIEKEEERPPTYDRFFTPSVYSEREIATYRTNASALPLYMQTFIAEYGESFDEMSPRTLENTLLALFYDEATESGNPFIESYFTFERDLKNIITACSCRTYGKEADSHLIGSSTVTEALRKTSTKDFGLSQVYPFVEDIVTAFEERKIESLERLITRIVWEFVESALALSYFSAKNVFGYFIQLNLLMRWEVLDKEAGKEKRTQLITEMKKEFTLPDTL